MRTSAILKIENDDQSFVPILAGLRFCKNVDPNKV